MRKNKSVTRKTGDDPIRGDHYMDEHGIYFVMAVADGYAMCRRKGCFPFIKKVKEVVGR